MIQTLATSEAIQQLNEYGRQRLPFLFIIDFLAENPVVIPLHRIDPEELRYDFNGHTNSLPADIPLSEPFEFHKFPISLEEYQAKFEYVISQLKRGNSFLVNLSVCTNIEPALELKSVFMHSKARYKLWWRDKFVCFSPEIFVQIRGNRIASFPMKGTIDRHIPNAAARILSDTKEAAEHATIVDLIRNDLSMIADKVWVERYRYLDEIFTNQKTLLQVSSEVAGQMPENWRDTLGNWLFQLLPAGSISGAPKPRTLSIIRQAEAYERGYYTGVAGIFDGVNLDSGVLIRFIEKTDNQLIFKSGGGITARSDLYAEYQEVIDKVYLPIPHAPTPFYRNHSSLQRPAVSSFVS